MKRLRVATEQLGVRAFLFAVLSLSTVLPVALLGITQAKRWAHNEEEATDRQAEAAARSVADEISLVMLEYAHATSTLAAQMAARGAFDHENAASVLKAYCPHHPEFLGAYLTNTEGISLANMSLGTSVTNGGIDYADREYFREAALTGQPAISRVQLGKLTHKLAVNIGAPIFDERQSFRGIACSSVDLNSLTERAKESAHGMIEGRVVLIDRDGQRIADSDAAARALDPVAPGGLFAAAKTGVAELRVDLDDRQQMVRGIAVGLQAPVVGWRVIAMVPQSSIDQKARQVAYQTAFISMLLVLIALVLAGWVASWLSRPLRSLAASAHQVTRGEWGALPTLSFSVPKEMMQLTVAVRTMVESLRTHSAELETQVAARTNELSRANTELTSALATNRENDKRLREDIAQARLFQEKMLPVLPAHSALDLAVAYAPLEQVSGDIYDLVQLRPDCIRIFLADATGHGVQAAMRTILLKSAYDRIKGSFQTPNELLAALNGYLVTEFPGGDLHCAACCIDLKVTESRVEVSYSNAGNSPLYVFSPGQPTRELYGDGPLLGVDHVEWPEPERFHLEPAQLLLVPSDGLAEQWNPLRQRFEMEIPRCDFTSQDSATTLLKKLMAAFGAFRGTRTTGDDLTVISVRVIQRDSTGDS